MFHQCMLCKLQIQIHTHNTHTHAQTHTHDWVSGRGLVCTVYPCTLVDVCVCVCRVRALLGLGMLIPTSQDAQLQLAEHTPAMQAIMVRPRALMLTRWCTANTRTGTGSAIMVRHFNSTSIQRAGHASNLLHMCGDSSMLFTVPDCLTYCDLPSRPLARAQANGLGPHAHTHAQACTRPFDAMA